MVALPHAAARAAASSAASRDISSQTYRIPRGGAMWERGAHVALRRQPIGRAGSRAGPRRDGGSG